jgi:hypothetical protein
MGKLKGDQEAAAAEKAKLKALGALAPALKGYAIKIANEVIAPVLRDFAESMTDHAIHPVITDHGRTLTVEGYIGSIRIAVNLHVRFDGRLGINVFGGTKDTLDESLFDLDTPNEPIRDWFGNTIADYFGMAPE